MAKKKLKPPPGRSASRRPAGNLGWWLGIGALVLIGILLVVVSRSDRTGSDIVRELEAPTIGDADEVTIESIPVEPFDRIDEGDVIFTASADGETREVTSPIDGFVVALAFSEGDTVETGGLVATVQTGVDFDATNTAGQHWHTAYGVYVCNTWLPPVGEFTANIHSHGDGLFHAHPLSNAEAGRNATVREFFVNGGMSISETSLRYSDGNTYRSGEVDCDGEEGVLQWALNGEVMEGDPGDLVIGNGDVLAVAFVPEGEEFPTLPPTTPQLPEHGVVAKHPDFQASEGEAGEGEAGEGEAGEGEADEGEATTTTAPGSTTTAAAPEGGE